jgi:hypothetical protein
MQKNNTARLVDFCEIHFGRRLRDGNQESDATKIRLVRGADLFRGVLNSEQLEACQVTDAIPEALRIRPGDILVPCVTRRPCARLVGSELVDCFADRTITIVRPRPGNLPGNRLAAYLSSSEFLGAVSKYASTLNGALHLTAKVLSELPFVVPTEWGLPSDSVISLMDRLARDIIRVIAQNSGELRHVEWRQLERVLATAFEGLGFEAELTPASKDGGKDIVLTCMEQGTKRRYVVEVKHWVSGKAVGGSHLRKFLDVIVSGEHDSGLFLSTSGFARNAQDSVMHLEHRRMRLAGAEKVVGLCQMYVRGESGLWVAKRGPTDALFVATGAPTHWANGSGRPVSPK